MQSRQLPHDSQFEQTILCSLLFGADCDLSIDDFYHPHHRLIYQAQRKLIDSGQPCELTSVVKTLMDAKTLKSVGGTEYLMRLHEGIPTSHLDYYVEKIKEWSRQRQLVNAGHFIADLGFSTGNGNVDQLVGTAFDRLDTIQPIIHRPAAFKDILLTLRARISEVRERGGLLGWDPGYRFLKETIGAAIPGMLWMIGGYTSVGKSAMAVDVCNRILLHNLGVNITIFSLEMESIIYALRFLAVRSGVHTHQILTSKVSPNEKESIKEAATWFSAANIHIVDDLYDYNAIVQRARHHKREFGLDICVIDYVQNLRHDGSIYELTAKFAPRLLQLAKDLQCTVIGISQIPDEAIEGAAGLRFKGGGEWAANADLGIWLTRLVDKREFTADVRKNRHGPLGRGELTFNENFTQILER